MSKIQLSAERTPHDLSHLIFSMGEVGRLQTLSVTPVLGGDSFQTDLVGSIKLSPLRRGLSLDSVVDVLTFYIPHRYAYGDDWEQFLKDGVNASPLPAGESVQGTDSLKLNHLGINVPEAVPNLGPQPKWLLEGYANIWNNYFKYPWDTDRSSDIASLTDEEGYYGFSCAHIKALWNTPTPNMDQETNMSIPVSGSEGSIDIQKLDQAYGKLHTEQERSLYAQRFRDVVEMLGGSTSYDADQRPQLLKRTTTWASGYDVDGTSEVSLGQYTGRVSQSISHSVPRFYCREHGSVWTVALLRFPPVDRSEANYLMRQGSPTYTDLVGDPAIVANHPPVQLNGSDVYNISTLAAPGRNPLTGDGLFPHSQWYRYAAPVVHGRYTELQGFPFIETLVTSGARSTQVAPWVNYVQSNQYDEIFQTTQMAHWNMQAKNNVKVMRSLPSARSSLMTS